MNFSRKHIVITGACGGIGSLLAKYFASKGAHCILIDLDAKRLTHLAKEISTEKNPAAYYPCNISNSKDIAKTCSKLLREFGSPDILINNAGIVTGKSFFDLTENDIELTLRINVMGPMILTKLLFEDSKKGHVVNISSAAGLVGVSKLSDYCASKAALFAFNESLRVEFAKLHIPINLTVVCPFYINTGMFAGVKTRFPALLPIVSTEYAVKKIAEGIAKKKNEIIFPRLVKIIPGLRLFPARFF